MNNLAKRLVTGAILIMIIIPAVIISGISFVVLVMSINVFALLEFYRLFSSPVLSPRRLAGIALSLCLLLSLSFVITGMTGWQIFLANVAVVAIIFISELFLQSTTPFQNLAFTFLGFIYITGPLCFFITTAFLPLRAAGYHYEIILGYFLILWAGDSGAYLTGKTWGRHFLFKRISPKKTWEGSIGGMCCAILVAYAISFFLVIISTKEWIIMAFIIIVTGTFGDLIKSLMKRSLHIKDSGTILPGHGGMLDRFDTLLGSAPFVFSFLVLRHIHTG